VYSVYCDTFQSSGFPRIFYRQIDFRNFELQNQRSFGAAQDAERSPGCSASSGPTSSFDGADAGQTRARASVRASVVQ
jgi:hypothetical protein